MYSVSSGTALAGCEEHTQSPAPAIYQPGGIAVTGEGSEKAEWSRAQDEPPSLPNPALSVVVQAAMLPRACSGIRAGSCA